MAARWQSIRWSSVAEAGRFESELLLVNFDLEQRAFVAQEPVKPLPKMAEIYQALVLAVSDYVNHSGFLV